MTQLRSPAERLAGVLAIAWLLFVACLGATLSLSSRGEAGPPQPGHASTPRSANRDAKARAERGTAGIGHGAGPGRRLSPVYAKAEIHLRFSHRQHLTQGMDCTECHEAAAASTRSSERLIPSSESCDRCHGDAHPRTRAPLLPGPLAAGALACEACHVGIVPGGPPLSSRFESPALHFSHAMHKAGTQAPCESCHRGVEQLALATEAALPSEGDCLRCHDGRVATDRCGSCHPSQAGGRLMTRTRQEPGALLVPGPSSSWGVAHDAAFVMDHRGPAKASGELCKSCHTEASCLECHAGVLRPMRIHASDYLTMHGIEAKGRVSDCDSCHRGGSDCSACHERLGVTQDSGIFATDSGRGFHPADWAGPPGSLAQGHAWAAQQNLSACASCHSEDSCLACHATTNATIPSLGVSPHGDGFWGSARCRTLAAANRRVCLRCHAPFDALLECG